MAKGLAIILVIIGHISFTPSMGKTILYLFLYFLFFFSYLVYITDKYATLVAFSGINLKGLLSHSFYECISYFLNKLFILYPDQVLSFSLIFTLLQNNCYYRIGCIVIFTMVFKCLVFF